MPAWSQRVYTLSRVIKEEKKDEEKVGNLESKREKVGKTESEEEKRGRKLRGVGFLVFSFQSKGVTREDILTGEGGFFFLLNWERVSRE